MKTRKWTAALLAAAFLLSVTGTALADHNTNVPGAVYSDDHAKGFNKDHKKTEEDLAKAGVKDVQPDYWAAGSISVLTESGLLAPDKNGNVKPEAKMKADEGIAVFAKVLGLASKTDDAATAVAKAKEAGLVSSGTAVDHDMSRMEVARLLAKALGVKPKDPTFAPFVDADGLAADDLAILAALYEAGIFKGYPDKTFRPGRILTKAEVAILVDRILGAYSK